MPSVNVTSNVSGGGITMSTAVSRTVDSVSVAEVTLSAGKTVTAWVKTDANTAACDLPGGHGYTNGNFDVYWSGGMRYGVAGTITTNALALDGGAGDDFPASATTGVIVTKQVQVNVAIDGDEVSVLALNLRVTSTTEGQRGSCAFYTAAAALIVQVELPVAPYDIDGGATNPFTGTPITYALCSNGTTTDGTLQIIVGQDSTP